MLNKLFVYLQYLLPQHFLSAGVRKLAKIRIFWIKNTLIFLFLKRYPINMAEAQIEDPYAYSCFNDFFTRRLKASSRLINETDIIVSPVDGIISQQGKINNHSLIQAKGHFYQLKQLLAGDTNACARYKDGFFSTIYLAPQNYHRVHMPVKGTLIRTIYVPGKLFSVNNITTQLVPQLFTRNERLICYFTTEFGEMAVILVGALFVGNIETVWSKQAFKNNQILPHYFKEDINLEKGAELGLFNMGSTVILLFQKSALITFPHLSNKYIQMGQALF